LRSDNFHMKQSFLFTKTSKEPPRDEQSINAKMLSRAGFVDKLMSGVFSYLPLGLMVLRKIEKIIREEMQNIGGQEVLLPSLHPKSNWDKTGRFKEEEMFKFKDRKGSEVGLGWTHEEIITPLAKKFISSYKDFPVYIYQIQNKFRNELRAKSGLLRGVEFLMKDLYSFHKDEKDLDNFYQKVQKAYLKIFKRCGLQKQTFLVAASGGTFSKYSHEFQTITDYGEDEIYLCPKCKLGVNKEIIEQENFSCVKCKNKKLEVKKSIEVGNIFKLKDRFSRPFNLFFKDEKGKESPVLMGCYGIGLGRLMGAVVEVCNDERGIVWPKELSPFDIHLVLGSYEKKEVNLATKIYNDLSRAGLSVLFDDRIGVSLGEKLVDSDLIGISTRILLSKKSLVNNVAEIKKRESKMLRLVRLSDLNKFFII